MSCFSTSLRKLKKVEMIFRRSFTPTQSYPAGVIGYNSDNVPVPTSLGDFCQLFRGPRMILWRRAVDWRPDQCLLRVEIQSAIGLNDIAKTLKLVENSMKASSMHWFMAHRGELRKFGIWPNRDQPPRSFVIRGEVSEEERRWLEGLGWDDVQEGRRHLLSLPDHKE